MVQLLQAGLLAAQHQVAMVTVITTLSLIASQIAMDQGGAATKIDVLVFLESASPFLTWAYLVAALGLAATSGEHINATAEGMKKSLFVSPRSQTFP
jgi:hypothetical protein